jgi:acetyl-CoA synthetase
MPMIPEAAMAMLACARIGAVHSVVFGGFSPESLKDRILDSDCRVVITADEGVRGGRKVPLKANVDTALKACPNVHTVLVVRHTEGKIAWDAEARRLVSRGARPGRRRLPAEEMDAEDPLFILYTSGSTGKPKGVLHTTGGYLLYAAMTHKYVFDYHDGDVYWCTADVGWVTGHTYIVYGPARQRRHHADVRGHPHLSDTSRFWEVIDKHQVRIFYTAPTAIRALMRDGDGPVKKTSRKSLQLLGTVGEPINPEAWEWYHKVVGDGRVPIVDTWWQTETGGILITPLPGATALKPGSATGRSSASRRRSSTPTARCRRAPARATWSSPAPGRARCVPSTATTSASSTPISRPIPAITSPATARAATPTAITGSPGASTTCINVSGHRLGTAEVESALVLHDAVAEAAVVGFPHEIKGTGIYCLRDAHERRVSRATRCARSWPTRCARRSARSPRPT